jgi:hypothetical protein
VLLHRLHEHLDALQTDPAQALAELHAQIGGDAAGPPVGDRAVGVDGAEVPPRGDVATLQLEVDAERLQDPAPHRVAQRIVAEEAQVPGAAARGDPGADVAEQPARGVAGEAVESGDVGGLELALAGARLGQTSEAIERAEHDLGGGGLHEGVEEL